MNEGWMDGWMDGWMTVVVVVVVISTSSALADCRANICKHIACANMG